MKAVIDRVWRLLETTVEEFNKEKDLVELVADGKKNFGKRFRGNYNYIKENYMKKEVNFLDRHKVSAIIIVSLLEVNPIKYHGEISDDQVFLGEYFLIAAVGFNYLQECLNEILAQSGIDKIEKIYFPEPFSCNVAYFDIFCRNLYFAKSEDKWGLNPLDIAKELFLLEYMTIREMKIDPQVLKESYK